MTILSDIHGFHAHVYFDADTRATAERVHEALARRFGVTLGSLVGSLVGPHTKPMFEITLAPDEFPTVVPWLMLHRDGLSVLVHPITDDDVADHERHTLWMGEVLPIDVERIRTHLRAMHTKNGRNENEKEVGT
jgi:DOPA 4,5-dioxygenase